jgi:hypothetical protein
VNWHSIDETDPAPEWRSIDEGDGAAPAPEREILLHGVLATGPRGNGVRRMIAIGVVVALLNKAISFGIALFSHLAVFVVVAGIVHFVRDDSTGDVALFAGLHGGNKGTQEQGEKEKQNEQTQSIEKLSDTTTPVAPQPESKVEPVPAPAPGPAPEVKANPVASDKQLEGRGGNRRGEMLKKYGGNDASESAVERGLEWLAAHQDADGGWDAEEFSRRCPKDECRTEGATGDHAYSPGVTALAVLAFLGAGHTHQEGPWAKTIERALGNLRSLQHADGGFSDYETVNFYNHTICTWAMAEAYALSHDEQLKESAQKGLDYLVERQYRGGGWDYDFKDDPDAERNDTSIAGWAVMAMKSGQMGGLKVPKPAVDRVAKLIELRTDRRTGEMIYADRTPGAGRKGDGLVAVGMLCRIYLGLQDMAPLKGGAGRLMRNLPDWKKMEESSRRAAATGGFDAGCNMYYWYYGTLAMFQVGGEYWEAWNGALRDMLVERQRKEGHRKGSWDPETNYVGREGGRVFSTAINVLNLEIYYRYLPLYAVDERLAAKLKWDEKGDLMDKARNAPSNGERVQAMTDLAKRKGDADVTALLAQAVTDRDPVVRLAAARLLGDRKDKTALKFLEEAIRKEDSPIKGAMLEQVGRIGEKSSLTFLIGFLRDENDRVAKGAATALRTITGQNFGTDADAWTTWWKENK